MLRISDCVADRVWLGVPQPTEWQRIGNQINAASIFGVIENNVLQLLGSSFSSRCPTGLHQLGKPLPSSRGDSTLFFGRGRSTHLLASLQSGPASSGGRREFGAGRRRHPSSVARGCRPRWSTAKN